MLDGPGRLRLRLAAVNRAGEQLVDWAEAWRPYLSAMPTDPQQIARLADRSDDRPRLWTAFDSYARHHAEHAHPEHARLRAAADAARNAHEQARHAVAEAGRRREERLDPFGPEAWTPDPTGRLTDLDRDIAITRRVLTDTRARIAALAAEPALRAQPPERLDRERETWRTRRTAGPDQPGSVRLRPTAPVPGVLRPEEERLGPSLPRRDTAPGIGR